MVDLQKINKIKELYSDGRYDEIALFIEPNFRIYNIISMYEDLTEAEKIIASISYYKYRLDNPLTEVFWNFEKKNIDLKCEMFHLGGLDEGIKELIDTNNEYFKKNVKLFVDIDFLKNCNSKSILYFYNMGYKDVIINNIKNYKINSVYLIEELLSDKEFKEKIISADFLLHGFNSRYKGYFMNLPIDRRELLSLYGALVFGDNNYNEDTFKKFRNILKELYDNNFPMFNDSLKERLIQLYGKIPYQAISYTLKNLIDDDNYLDKMQEIADKYFDKRIEIVLSFAYKYPLLSTKIYNTDYLNSVIIRKIVKLSNIGVLENIDSLSIDQFLECDINNFFYSFDNNTRIRNHSIIGPANLNDSIVLYNYCYGVAVIDKDGKWEEYLVSSSHYGKLNEIYPYNKKSGLELLYDITVNGDIVFASENAGLIIWMPSVITSSQMKKVVDKLEEIKNVEEAEIYFMIANLDKENEFISFNNDIPINVETAIESIKRIRVKDLVKEKNKLLKKK